MIFNKDKQKEHTRTYYTKKGIKTVKVNKGNKRDRFRDLVIGTSIGITGTLGLGYLLRKKLLSNKSTNLINVPSNTVKSSQVIPVEVPAFTPKNTSKSIQFPKIIEEDFTPKKPTIITFPKPEPIKTKPKYTSEEIPDYWLEQLTKESNINVSRSVDNIAPINQPKLLSSAKPKLELDEQIKKKGKFKIINKPKYNVVELNTRKYSTIKSKSKNRTSPIIYLGKNVDESIYLPKSKTLVEDLRLPLDDSESKLFKEYMSDSYKDNRRYLQPNKDKLDLIYKNGSGVIDKYKLDGQDVLALASYTDTGYIGVNGLLRGQLNNSTDEVKNISTLLSRQLNQALDKLPIYKGRVFRGTRLTDDILQRMNEGEIVKLDGFLSTSSYLDVLEDYSKKHKIPKGFESLQGTTAEVKQTTKQGKYDVIAKELGLSVSSRNTEREVEMYINSISGRKLGQLITSTPTDLEVLFKSNSRFRVKSKSRKGSKYIIELDELEYDEVTSYNNTYNNYLVQFKKLLRTEDNADISNFINRITDNIKITFITK